MSNNNIDALVFETQIVIEDTTTAGVTSGSIVNKGGLSTFDTYIKGNASINNVNITPNLNDIIFEQQSILANNKTQYEDIPNFSFDSSIANSFKAFITVNVSTGISLYSMWEINGLYKPSGWVITSSFSGDLTGVQFSIQETSGVAIMQYTNSNTSGTTTIRYRATTTAPPGSTPIGETVGYVANTTGPFVTDKFIYASTPNTFASSELGYVSNAFTIGGGSRLMAENANSFTNYSNGGAITSMGDASIAKKLIVGEKIGVNNTAPSFAVDVGGDINLTGNFYKNGNIYSVGGDSWTTLGNNINYTIGNVSIGTTDASYKLNVKGTSLFTSQLQVNNQTFSSPTTSTLGGSGSRIVLVEGSESIVPYSIGAETDNMWFASELGGFKWYNGTNASMQLNGSNLIITGELTAFGNISDQRLKTNVQNISSISALDTINSLRPVTFDWKDDIFNTNKRNTSDAGFIAQEVEPVIPYAVSEFDEINSGITYKNMKHERIIPYLVGSIQHLHTIIKDLESRIEDLHSIIHGKNC